MGRSLRGSVDRNSLQHHFSAISRGRSLRGSVDRNSLSDSIMTRNTVAPFAGAWIETLAPTLRCIASCGSLPSRERGSKHHVRTDPSESRRSLPSRERGSKHQRMATSAAYAEVAPFAGAWIETTARGADRGRFVAPFAGAWIETIETTADSTSCARVAPFAGAWIETRMMIEGDHRPGGRSLRGSVDRNMREGWQVTSCLSLPSRERGSKLARRRGIASRRVAPFAGAWIETCDDGRDRQPTRVAPFAGAWIETRLRHA